MIVGIDAANLRRGGGVTHLVELLSACEPASHGVARVVVWGSTQTLAKWYDRPWLEKVSPPALGGGLLQRTWWQRFQLSKSSRAANCSVLFVPGGSYAGTFRPVVTLSQNLLPFEWPELRRYGWASFTLKLLLLRLTQSQSFRKADGVIFLTEYARQTVLGVTGKLAGKTAIVPHGLNPRFQIAPKEQLPLAAYSAENPFRLLYVSIIDQYKHQWHVAEAVHALRSEGLPVVLDLIGPAYQPALARLQTVLDRLDPAGTWARYHGAIPYEDLHQMYGQADLGIFASSCENMPNILLETMAAGLPIACSNRGPMPEVLGDTGLYFDPEKPAGLAQAIRIFLHDPELRYTKAQAAFSRAQGYSWGRCATQTFDFLMEVGRNKS